MNEWMSVELICSYSMRMKMKMKRWRRRTRKVDFLTIGKNHRWMINRRHAAFTLHSANVSARQAHRSIDHHHQQWDRCCWCSLQRSRRANIKCIIRRRTRKGEEIVVHQSIWFDLLVALFHCCFFSSENGLKEERDELDEWRIFQSFVDTSSIVDYSNEYSLSREQHDGHQ